MLTTCPFCKQTYEVEEQYLGRQIECQKCKREFTIGQSQEPRQESSPVPPAPAPAPAPAKTGAAVFKVPLLTHIFNVFGGLSVAGTLFCIAGAVLMSIQKENIFAGMSLLPLIFATLLNALIMFGLSELVKAISETAFNTRQLLKIQSEKR